MEKLTKKQIAEMTQVKRLNNNNFSYSVTVNGQHFKKDALKYDILTDEIDEHGHPQTIAVAPANNKKEFVDEVYDYIQ